MAGQLQQSFRENDPRLPDISGAASVRTQQATPAPTPQYAGAQKAQAFQALSNAFGNFFGGMNQTLQNVNNTIETEQLVQTQRENEALQKQAVADQGEGRPMDPQYKDRQSYYESYQNAAADSHAFDLSQGLAQKLREMPKDGSVNPADVAADYFRQEFGSGTGDRDFDSRLLYQYHQTAQRLVAATNEQVAQTVERNTTAGIINDAVTQMNSPEGMTPGKFADLNSRILSVTRGDQVQADKIVEAALSDPRNLTQSLSMLNSLQESGWADRNPDAYNRISQQAVANIHKVKSVQAGMEVDNWNARAHALALNPNATAADWAQMAYEAHQIDSNHGVGMDKFGMMFAGMRAAATRQAGVNLFLQTLNGFGGSHDPGVVATHFGEKASAVTDKYMDPGISQLVSGPGSNYPALRESMGGNAGYVDPLADDQTPTEFASLISQPAIRQASDNGMPPRIKTQVSNALLGTDPVKGARAFQLMTQLEARVGTAGLSRYFADPNAELVYQGMKAIAPANGDVSKVFQDVRDNWQETQKLAKQYEAGNVNLAEIFGQTGMKPDEIDKAFRDGMAKALAKTTDRDGVFTTPTAGISPSQMNQLKAMVAYQGIKLQGAGALDLKTAIANTATVFQNRFLALPGKNGAVSYVQDPFDGQGRAMRAPLNGDPNSPISTLKGYGAVYSGFPMINALGEQEDPVKTARKDLELMHKTLPGMVADSDQLSLGRPRADGLMPILNITGQPIQIAAGQNISVLSDEKVPFWSMHVTQQYEIKPAKVPNDPQEAQEFFKKYLPPGVFPVYSPSSHTYTLHYGFRLMGDEEAREASLAKQAQRYNELAPVNPPANLGVTF